MVQLKRFGVSSGGQAGGAPRAEPFRSAADAWFWTMSALVARRDGARFVAHAGKVARPCEPDDVVRSLDVLYQHGRIDAAQARVLRIWGERGVAPDAGHGADRYSEERWTAALAQLASPLRLKGIVA